MGGFLRWPQSCIGQVDNQPKQLHSLWKKLIDFFFFERPRRFQPMFYLHFPICPVMCCVYKCLVDVWLFDKVPIELSNQRRIFAEPFGCSDEQCKCGSNCRPMSSYTEDEMQELEHLDYCERNNGLLPHPKVECRPTFKTPLATTHVILKPRRPLDPVNVRYLGKCDGDFQVKDSSSTSRVFVNKDGIEIALGPRGWSLSWEGASDNDAFHPHLSCCGDFIAGLPDDPQMKLGVWENKAGSTCIVDCAMDAEKKK